MGTREEGSDDAERYRRLLSGSEAGPSAPRAGGKAWGLGNADVDETYDAESLGVHATSSSFLGLLSNIDSYYSVKDSSRTSCKMNELKQYWFMHGQQWVGYLSSISWCKYNLST